MHVSVARFFGYKPAPGPTVTSDPAAMPGAASVAGAPTVPDDTGNILEMLNGAPDG